MRAGADPTEACKTAISRIKRRYSQFFGAIICANTTGHFGEFLHALDIKKHLKTIKCNKYVSAFQNNTQ